MLRAVPPSVCAATDEDAAREVLLTEELSERRVGALVVTPTSDDHAALRAELDAGLPVVLIDRPAEGIDAETFEVGRWIVIVPDEPVPKDSLPVGTLVG